MINFDDLYEKNYNKVFFYLIRTTNNEKLAEDITQDTFYRALIFMNTSPNIEISISWLIKVSHNIFIDYLRKNKIDKYTLTIDAFDGVSVDNYEKTDIVKALQSLPFKYKELILLKDYFGFSYKEICEITESSESNIKVEIHRARKKFKEVYSYGNK